MNNFYCIKCNKNFKTKQQLNNHINRKNPCNKILKCNRCYKEFKKNHHLTNHINRKFPCDKIELEQENRELKLKVENLELKLENQSLKLNNNSMINSNINSNNTIIINNFGEEDISKIKKKLLSEEIQKLLNNTLPLQIKNNTDLKVEDLKYKGIDVLSIDMFRFFIKLIFNNDNFPENKTIKYNEEEDTFYYYYNNEWSIIDNDSKEILIERITKKIQKLLLDKKPISNQSDLKKLDIYLGEDYDIKINKIDDKDYALLYNSSNRTKQMYNKVLRIEYKYKNVFNNHEKNIEIKN